MAVYALAQLRIHDAERYGRYAADTEPRVLEGAWWDRNKVVLMEFPDQAAFTAWATSPEYNEIAVDRVAGAEAVVLLIKGFEGA